LEFLGVTLLKSGFTTTLWENVNGEEGVYEVGGYVVVYETDGVAKEFRVRGFKPCYVLSGYDWVTDDGYGQFRYMVWLILLFS